MSNAPQHPSPRVRSRRPLFLLVAVAGVLGLGYVLWSRGKLPFVPGPGPVAAKELEPIRTLSARGDAAFTRVAFFPNGTWVIAGVGASELFVWDVGSGKVIGDHKANLKDNAGKVYRDRFNEHERAARGQTRLALTQAAGPTGLLSTLAATGLPPSALDRLGRKSTLPPGSDRSVFAYRTGTAHGTFRVIETPAGPRVVAFVGAEYSWDPKYEYDPPPPPERMTDGAPPQVTMSRFELSTAAFGPEPGSVSTHATVWTREGELPSPRGFSADGRRLLALHPGGGVRLAEAVGDDEPMFTAFRETRLDPTASTLALHPDGKAALVRGPDNVLGVRDLDTGAERCRLAGATHPLKDFVFNGDGRFLATETEGRNPVVILWDLTTGAEVRRFGGYEGLLRGMALSPDGGRLLTAGWDGTLRLRDCGTGGEVIRLAHPEAAATAVAFSPDGRRAAVAFGREVRVWDLP